MLKDVIENKLIEARGVIAFYEANSTEDDDIILYDPANPDAQIAKFFTLRQQLDKDQDNFLAMSDFIVPQ